MSSVRAGDRSGKVEASFGASRRATLRRAAGGIAAWLWLVVLVDVEWEGIAIDARA
jgi:hypothetical protein